MKKINIKHKNILDLAIKNYEEFVYKSYNDLIKTPLAKDLKRQGIDFSISINSYDLYSGSYICINTNKKTLFNKLKYFDKLKIFEESDLRWISTLNIAYFNFKQEICSANYYSRTITFKNKVIDKIFDQLNARQQKQIINWLIDNHKNGYKFGKNTPECIKPYLLFI